MFSLRARSLLLLASLAAAVSSETPTIDSPAEKGSATPSLRGFVVSNERELIISGNRVYGNRYPYFALMNGNSLCGAVLVSRRFVLTAAHCVGSDNDFEIGILEIESNPNGSDSGGTEYPYKRGVIHPGYDDVALSNDIAIYELEEDVPERVKYIRLEQIPMRVPQTNLIAIGFGDTHPSEHIYEESDYLLRTGVKYISQNDCINQMNAGEIGPDMLCAFDEGEDTCYGDSGGPLILQGGSVSDDTLIGLTSWGYGCAVDTPSVYTRISFFYDWIIATMCAMNPDGVPDYVNCETDADQSIAGGDEIMPYQTLSPSNSGTTSSSTSSSTSTTTSSSTSSSSSSTSSLGGRARLALLHEGY